MATLRMMRSKWQVIIRKKNYPTVVRSFIEKSTASKFAKDVETQMDKQIFQDLSGASTTTLKELMIKYRDEIVPTQKAHRSTTATLNMLMKHRIAFYSLTQLKCQLCIKHLHIVLFCLLLCNILKGISCSPLSLHCNYRSPQSELLFF